MIASSDDFKSASTPVTPQSGSYNTTNTTNNTPSTTPSNTNAPEQAQGWASWALSSVSSIKSKIVGDAKTTTPAPTFSQLSPPVTSQQHIGTLDNYRPVQQSSFHQQKTSYSPSTDDLSYAHSNVMSQQIGWEDMDINEPVTPKQEVTAAPELIAALDKPEKKKTTVRKKKENTEAAMNMAGFGETNNNNSLIDLSDTASVPVQQPKLKTASLSELKAQRKAPTPTNTSNTNTTKTTTKKKNADDLWADFN